jgi:hypothetical protein
MQRRYTFIIPAFVEVAHGDKGDHVTRGATEVRIPVAAHDEQEAATMVSAAVGALLEVEMKRKKVEEARSKMHAVPREGGP